MRFACGLVFVSNPGENLGWEINVTKHEKNSEVRTNSRIASDYTKEHDIKAEEGTYRKRSNLTLQSSEKKRFVSLVAKVLGKTEYNNRTD